jgi:ribosome-binding ATPase YchF (GTP1/OBG family)
MIRSTTIIIPKTHKSFCIQCFSTTDTTLKSWERSARAVKNTDKTNKYLEHIRQEHDPALHIKTLEDELRGTMGKALGKQGRKVLRNIEAMKRQADKYQHLIAHGGSIQEIRECVQLHNQFRKDAHHARWELMVQRQAVGFLVNNQKYVHSMYPIDEALPMPNEEEGTMVEKEHKEIDSNDAKFGNQLDWWQRVGRWR